MAPQGTGNTPVTQYMPLLDVDQPDDSDPEGGHSDGATEHHSRGPPFCFLCWFGTQPNDTQRRQYVNILEAMIQNNAAFVNHRWLTQQIQEYYNRFLRPSIASSTLRRHWSRKVIWEHITKHRIDPMHAALSSARALNAMRMQLEANGLCIRGHDGGRGRLDVANAKLYLAITKALTLAMVNIRTLRPAGNAAAP